MREPTPPSTHLLTVFVDRRPREGRFLEWKAGLFSVAAVVTVVGFYLNERWMIGAAIVILAVAMLLRFLPGGGVVEEDEEEGWYEDAGADEGGGLGDRG